MPLNRLAMHRPRTKAASVPDLEVAAAATCKKKSACSSKRSWTLWTSTTTTTKTRSRRLQQRPMRRACYRARPPSSTAAKKPRRRPRSRGRRAGCLSSRTKARSGLAVQQHHHHRLLQCRSRPRHSGAKSSSVRTRPPDCAVFSRQKAVQAHTHDPCNRHDCSPLHDDSTPTMMKGTDGTIVVPCPFWGLGEGEEFVGVYSYNS